MVTRPCSHFSLVTITECCSAVIFRVYSLQRLSAALKAPQSRVSCRLLLGFGLDVYGQQQRLQINNQRCHPQAWNLTWGSSHSAVCWDPPFRQSCVCAGNETTASVGAVFKQKRPSDKNKSIGNVTRIDFLRQWKDGESAPQLAIISNQTCDENQSFGVLVIDIRLLCSLHRRSPAETLVEHRLEADSNLPMGDSWNSPGLPEWHVLGNPLLC